MFKRAFDIWHVYRRDYSIQGLSPAGNLLRTKYKVPNFS